MRIVSLLPSTTEILFTIGAGPNVVGVTFECDVPPEARDRRIVSTSALPEGLSPRAIDSFVTAAVARGDDLYHLDEGALRELDADLVVTQDLCAVCAVDVSVVDAALDYLGCTADVLTIDPHTIDEVLAAIVTLGERTGCAERAAEVVSSLSARLHAVRATVEAGRAGPESSAADGRRVMVLEWTDPPFTPGHWVPEMVTVAGGIPTLGVPGRRSARVTWDAVLASAPDIVVAAPCGYNLDAATELAIDVRRSNELPPEMPLWAVDANASFARPGPRLVDGIEALAAIVHPTLFPPPSPTMARAIPADMPP